MEPEMEPEMEPQETISTEDAYNGWEGQDRADITAVRRPSLGEDQNEQTLDDDLVNDLPDVVRNKKRGGLVYQEHDVIKLQRSVGWSLLKELGRNILERQNLITVSMSVKIFQTRSFLQRMQDFWRYNNHYLTRAADLVDQPLERMKMAISAAIATQHIVVVTHRKPFNPILGETWQASYPDGTRVYMEQATHHPPGTRYQIFGPKNKWCLIGYGIWSAAFRGNSIRGGMDGWNFIIFQDGTVIAFYHPFYMAHGIMFGERWVKCASTTFCSDEKNGIFAEVDYDYEDRRKHWYSGLVNIFKFGRKSKHSAVRAAEKKAGEDAAHKEGEPEDDLFVQIYRLVDQQKASAKDDTEEEEALVGDFEEDEHQSDVDELNKDMDEGFESDEERAGQLVIKSDDLETQIARELDHHSELKTYREQAGITGFPDSEFGYIYRSFLRRFPYYASRPNRKEDRSRMEKGFRETLSIGRGSWLHHIDFDGKRMWDMQDEPQLISGAASHWKASGDHAELGVLKSDCNYRADLNMLKKGDVDGAQKTKSYLENLQRRDRKLRKGESPGPVTMK